jgi:hypothetical protein
LGFRVQGSGFRVQGLEFRVQGEGFRAEGLGFRQVHGVFIALDNSAANSDLL